MSRTGELGGLTLGPLALVTNYWAAPHKTTYPVLPILKTEEGAQSQQPLTSFVEWFRGSYMSEARSWSETPRVLTPGARGRLAVIGGIEGSLPYQLPWKLADGACPSPPLW